jgi:RNA polymerase sigma-70 factor (ECF subfamily)
MQPQTADDPGALILAVARGDRAALARLYDRFSPVAYAVALRILGNRADAEDVVQEVFLQVWKRGETFRPDRGSFECWLLTIARNQALARIRAAHTIKRHLARLRLDPGGSVSEPTDGSVDCEESSLALHSALTKLPDEQRLVLELAYFDGLTQSEIAARLDEPLGTVKTRIRLGLARLKQLVGRGRMPGGAP